MISADFVASYLDAWNERDADAVADHLADGGTYCDMPTQRQLSGNELIAHLREYFSRDHCQYQLVGDILVGENSIAFQYRALPEEDSGQRPWTGAEFVTFEGDSVVRIEDYYRSPELDAATGQGGRWQRRVQRYAKSGLDDAALKDCMHRLSALMNDQHCYLEPNLTLPQLAERMDCSVNHLSQVINAGFGMSFYDYINGYRVRRAEQLLGASESGSQAILDVALAVGFNSSSTFYSAFKKATGVTPAQYRKTGDSAPVA
jgi:AraC-like DNA-binding protein